MARIFEILLFLAPFVVFAVWLRLNPSRTLSRAMIVFVFALLALMGGGLVWLRLEDAIPPNAHYVPARMQDGRIVAPVAVPPGAVPPGAVPPGAVPPGVVPSEPATSNGAPK